MTAPTFTTPGSWMAFHANDLWLLADTASPELIADLWRAISTPGASADDLLAAMPDEVGCSIAQATHELRLIVRHPATATVTHGDESQRFAPDALAPVDTTIPIPHEVTFGEASSEVGFPLALGASPSSSLRFTLEPVEVPSVSQPIDEPGSPQPEEPNLYLGLLSGEPLPEPEPEPLPEPIHFVPDPPTPEPVGQPPATPVPQIPTLPVSDFHVAAVVCSVGHQTDPALLHCRWCGAPVPPQSPVEVQRPALGRIIMPNGDAIPLDKNIVIGRAPQHLGSADQHVITVNTTSAISRMHVLITLEGWNVYVRDLNTTNGTSVGAPGQPLRVLAPGQDQLLEPGSEIDLADAITLRFDLSL